ncbi:hypothetical protein [Mycobacterium sp. IS-1556]|uniref:hypothetical protein n=1 Tax=Mycobacterium sp. IS-1556 TaxID=1772276 RepID=UPI0007415472|nr:hypothetical protein [Mycobacterium sp. IS-1556]KUH89802.1 hypothetical protein AU187_16025 [Mycobacterium sp. IS-1556]
MPDLRTIRDVELVRVGTWQISTGDWTVTPADLASAVAAHKAGVLRIPVLKIGHQDPRFDGGPALGRVDNLRLAEGGQVLIGDFVDVPKPIATLLPRAWPDRSVEALINYEGPDGTVWPLVITAVALLGETAPGVDNLADIAETYGVAAARRISVAASTFHPDDHAAAERRRAVAVAAARRRRTNRTMTGV